MAADPLFDAAAIARWAQDTGIAGYMTSRWGWPINEVLHFFGLALLLGTVGMFDLRMLGIARGVSLRALHRLVPLGVAGFALSASTGFLFVVTTPDQYLYNPALQTKLLLMLVAAVNLLLFYASAAGSARATGDADVPPLRARVFAAISLACWLGVITLGRVITAYRPPFHWCAWC